MIDMKQIKDNVSNKLKAPEDAESTSFVFKDTSSRNQGSTPMAIGSTIHIKGDVTGDEDLIIHGHVEGQINLKDHNVIIGKNGKVEANINAKQIVVEGELNGDLNGEEKVVIRETGNVLGNVVSPRVTLEDGAMFKGSIEMEPRQKNSFNKASVSKSDSKSDVKTSFNSNSTDTKAIA